MMTKKKSGTVSSSSSSDADGLFTSLSSSSTNIYEIPDGDVVDFTDVGTGTCTRDLCAGTTSVVIEPEKGTGDCLEITALTAVPLILDPTAPPVILDFTFLCPSLTDTLFVSDWTCAGATCCPAE